MKCVQKKKVSSKQKNLPKNMRCDLIYVNTLYVPYSYCEISTNSRFRRTTKNIFKKLNVSVRDFF